MAHKGVEITRGFYGYFTEGMIWRQNELRDAVGSITNTNQRPRVFGLIGTALQCARFDGGAEVPNVPTNIGQSGDFSSARRWKGGCRVLLGLARVHPSHNRAAVFARPAPLTTARTEKATARRQHQHNAARSTPPQAHPHRGGTYVGRLTTTKSARTMLAACCAPAFPLSITRRNGAWSSGSSGETRNSWARALPFSATMSSHLRPAGRHQTHKQTRGKDHNGHIISRERLRY